VARAGELPITRGVPRFAALDEIEAEKAATAPVSAGNGRVYSDRLKSTQSSFWVG